MSFQDFPDELLVYSRIAGELHHIKDHTRFAISGPDQPPTSAPVEARIEDPLLTVYLGTPESAGLTDNEGLVPVYLTGGGSPGVPTGLVFVQFPAGLDPHSRSSELAAVGYRIREVPGYAKNAAWLEPMSGHLIDSLTRLQALKDLPGIESLEPQLVMAIGRR